MKLTSIEARVLHVMFSNGGISPGDADDIVSHMAVERREWSPDVAYPDSCVGQFVHLEYPKNVPIDGAPEHLAVWAQHPSLPGGVDFVLFLRDGVPMFLEVSFFGFSTPKSLLEGTEDDFAFAAQ
ncbi:hypothetical protein [Luteibacter sp. 3190]|uniref:hypothetical protein n=1 Tax=Luteibacter sp. 3190 TaxID=2817736 RepID=UPI00286BBA4F|nr:hypothetical protein [Luteibacter sp. 3190]